MRVGVIDVGTNSVRVLAADVVAGVVETEHARELTITRLGEGVDRDRRLGDEPMRRTAAAIAAYAAVCRDAGAGRIRIACTSAVRDAANRDDFLGLVRATCGIEPSVVPGDEEARLGFLGATSEISAPAPYCVLDIGGGSTELVTGGERAERWISIDVGSVRLTERHVHEDPPSPASLAAVAADVETLLDEVEAAVDPRGAATLVGLAGTITSAAAVALGLDGYDRDAIHGARLARGDIGAVRERLASMTSAERRRLPAMPRGREDVIVAGLVVLESVMDRFGFAEVLVSERDILDGLAIALAAGA